MHSLPLIRDLSTHLEWADAEVWTAVHATPAAATDAVLRERLRHVHATGHAFLAAWDGRDVTYSSAEDFPELAMVEQHARDFHRRFPTFLATLEESMLDRPMNVPWASYFAKRFGRAAAETTLGETLVQLAMHSGYHRGQINTRIRELGGTPPSVDYIIWLWIGKPAAKWG
jgi:uncharacterized damage-inducible protein DinB